MRISDWSSDVCSSDLHGVPVVVVDYGYLKRTNHAHDWKTGHWQVSIGGLTKLPRNVDSSRFDAPGLKVSEKGGDPMGYPLLCVPTTDRKSDVVGQRWTVSVSVGGLRSIEQKKK